MMGHRSVVTVQHCFGTSLYCVWLYIMDHWRSLLSLVKLKFIDNTWSEFMANLIHLLSHFRDGCTILVVYYQYKLELVRGRFNSITLGMCWKNGDITSNPPVLYTLKFYEHLCVHKHNQRCKEPLPLIRVIIYHEVASYQGHCEGGRRLFCPLTMAWIRG